MHKSYLLYFQHIGNHWDHDKASFFQPNAQDHMSIFDTTEWHKCLHRLSKTLHKLEQQILLHVVARLIISVSCHPLMLKW